MILVLGATGTTGGEVACQLIAAGQKPRLLVRSPEKAREFQGKAEIVPGELERPESVLSAMKGVEKLYLVSAGRYRRGGGEGADHRWSRRQGLHPHRPRVSQWCRVRGQTVGRPG